MQYQIYYILITVNILDKFLDTNLFNVFKATKLFCIYIMYKEKYLKYKTKYLELKNQLDGISNTIQKGGVWPFRTKSTQYNSNIDIQDEYKTLRIENKKEQFILIIDYNAGEINVLYPEFKQYTIWKTIPRHKDDNLWGDDFLFRSSSTDQLIYKELIETAIIELEKNNSTITPMKNQCIEQLKFYIKRLS